MVCGSLQSIAQYQLPMGEYILASVIVYILFLITYPLLMKLVGCDFSKLATVDVVDAFNVKKDAKLDIAQKISLLGLLIFIGVVVVCSFAPIPLFKAAYHGPHLQLPIQESRTAVPSPDHSATPR